MPKRTKAELEREIADAIRQGGHGRPSASSARGKRARRAEALRPPQKSANVIVYGGPSGYWYAQAYDATTDARITDASDYSRDGALRALRGKFPMIGVDIKSITEGNPYDTNPVTRPGRSQGSRGE
jgi:hypothetical protein